MVFMNLTFSQFARLMSGLDDPPVRELTLAESCSDYSTRGAEF
jgi:hypothetical protein